ncbi:hypothetical protein N665_5130s0001 [Sinapis alba]|nr:hypothetical protein N665_5130s0001 [Sinapis alba]
MCVTADRFYALGRVLGNMVSSLAEAPSPRLLKHIVRCYLRLTDNTRACIALKDCLPDLLSNTTFNSCLYDDPSAMQWLQQLLHNIRVRQPHGLENMFVV